VPVALLHESVAAADQQVGVIRLEAQRLIVVLYRSIEFSDQCVELPSLREGLGAIIRSRSIRLNDLRAAGDDGVEITSVLKCTCMWGGEGDDGEGGGDGQNDKRRAGGQECLSAVDHGHWPV